MRRLLVVFVTLWLVSPLAYAGPETDSGEEMKETASAASPQWYADREWQLNSWATYIFQGEDWTSFDDKYLEADHGWGGGLDFKYFFTRCLGAGLEGWVVDAKRHFRGYEGFEVFHGIHREERRAVGAILGTLTLRYPIASSRFAPYLFAGAGAIFGGGEQASIVQTIFPPMAKTLPGNDRVEAIGQFGCGIEVRLTPYIGWMNDFSWNIVGDGDSIFGMFRSGLTVAFGRSTLTEPRTDMGKESKQITSLPEHQWYADREFDFSFWGTYLFANESLIQLTRTYLESEDAWGGGVDCKYFFMRNFGIGLEGWMVNAQRLTFDRSPNGTFLFGEKSRAIGGLLGTLTVRFPILSTRLAPYAFAGGGAIFGGGERDRYVRQIGRFVHSGSQTEAIGQFGVGMEIRFTSHIGWMSDFSWDIVRGGESVFGMARSGLTLAF